VSALCGFHTVKHHAQMIAWLFAACLFHGGASGSASTPWLPVEPGEINLPFRYDPPFMPFIVVQVMINGQGPLPFVVDTGVSTPLLIDTGTAKKLQLRPNRLHGLVNGSVELASASINSISLIGAGIGERLESPQSSAYLVDLKMLDGAYTGPRIAGIIGAPLLAEYSVRFDFERKVMSVLTAGVRLPPISDATMVTLTSRNDGYNVVVSPQEGISVRLVVDTGAITSSLPISVSPYLKPIGSTMGRYRQLGFAVIGDRLRLATFNIGGLQDRDVAMDAAPSFVFAVLGLDLLSRFRVTLDFPQGKMILERVPNQAAKSHLRGWTGIAMESRGRGFRIREVAGNSPAAQAGATRGDEVLGVDGYRLDGVPPTVADELLIGYAGTQASLTIRRGGHLHTLQFVRRDEFAGPHGPLEGVILEKSDGGRPVVLRVAEGSPCERAGMVVHDEVLTLNGISTASLTADETWQQVRGPKVTLQVARRGQPRPIMMTLMDPWYDAQR
jgi:hypothetical protein